jgi:hypothetical protein
MPCCPQCGEEFQDWVKVCLDCGVALVDHSPGPPARDRRDEPIVHVATAPNEPVAQMWAGILEDNGIRCMVKRTGLRWASHAFICSQQCTIHVLASEAEKASQILLDLSEDNRDWLTGGRC